MTKHTSTPYVIWGVLLIVLALFVGLAGEAAADRASAARMVSETWGHARPVDLGRVLRDVNGCFRWLMVMCVCLGGLMLFCCAGVISALNRLTVRRPPNDRAIPERNPK